MKIIIKLQAVLDEIGMSQHELSRLADVRQPFINEMCQNKTKHLPLDNLARICEATGRPITDILELVPE